MVEIQIPADNREEREYVIRVIFSDFLGIPFDLVASDSALDYTISFGESKIVVKDGFFGQYKDTNTYLVPDSIPKQIIYAQNDYTVEDNIPVIFGSGTLQAD